MTGAACATPGAPACARNLTAGRSQVYDWTAAGRQGEYSQWDGAARANAGRFFQGAQARHGVSLIMIGPFVGVRMSLANGKVAR